MTVLIAKPQDRGILPNMARFLKPIPNGHAFCTQKRPGTGTEKGRRQMFFLEARVTHKQRTEQYQRLPAGISQRVRHPPFRHHRAARRTEACGLSFGGRPVRERTQKSRTVGCAHQSARTGPDDELAGAGHPATVATLIRWAVSGRVAGVHRISLGSPSAAARVWGPLPPIQIRCSCGAKVGFPGSKSYALYRGLT
jgi:hypothetical protein